MVLDDLYCGNIYPAELVNQFHTHVIDVHCMELEAHFQYGFSLGMMLMKEVFDLMGKCTEES